MTFEEWQDTREASKRAGISTGVAYGVGVLATLLKESGEDADSVNFSEMYTKLTEAMFSVIQSGWDNEAMQVVEDELMKSTLYNKLPTKVAN